MNVIHMITKKASENKKTIVLTESFDPRALQAAKWAAEFVDKVAQATRVAKQAVSDLLLD